MLYLIKRPVTHHDEVCAAVVRASSEDEARRLVAAVAMDEGAAAWLVPNVSVELLPAEGNPEVILTDVWEA